MVKIFICGIQFISLCVAVICELIIDDYIFYMQYKLQQKQSKEKIEKRERIKPILSLTGAIIGIGITWYLEKLK